MAVRQEDDAVVVVADTGVGISDGDIRHVFERLFRVDKSRARALGGAGLGLAISKAAVELHGGSVGVVSRQGVGSTFTVRLPISRR